MKIKLNYLLYLPIIFLFLPAFAIYVPFFSGAYLVFYMIIILSAFILFISVLAIPKLRTDWLVFLLSFFMVIGNAIYPIWFFQGMERMKYITFLNILAKTTFLVLIFVFVKNDSD